MLYQLALCAAILACASAEHERGQDRVAATNSDALSGSALHSHILHKHEHERKSVSQNEAGAFEVHERGQDREQEHSRMVEADDNLEAEASESLGEYGCVWDGTGSGLEDRMELNCDRLTEDECIAAGNGNKDGRCVWKAKNHAKGAHKDTITNAGKEQAMSKKVAADDRMDMDLDEDAQVAPLGCLWDGSGCAHDMCDEEQMVSRCDDLSHSKASCLGDMGQDRRCFWSHGSADDARKAAVAMKIMGLSVELPEEVEVVADAGNRHSAPDADATIEEDNVPQLGCLWDGSGCVQGQCDEEAMNARCAKLSHSKTSCLGSMGQDARCFWSHGAANEEEEFEHFQPAEVLDVVADAGSRHNAPDADAEIEEDNVPQLGCLWDRTGCVEGQCDEEAMTARCAKFSHSKTSCLGSMGQDARCFWSHGAADEEEFEHFQVLDVVADAGNRHSAQSENEEVEVAEDNLPQLGCLWDGTGCVQGQCDMEAMNARCAKLSHSKTSCLGSMGQDARCFWSHGADDAQAQMEDVLNGGFEGTLTSMKVSTMDILLGAAFVVTAAFALQRLYRWWADRGYIKLAEQPQDVEPLLMTQV